jgi:hypothetical protein
MPTEISMEIQTWPIGDLVFCALSPRKNDSAVDRMCGNNRKFDFKIPCPVRSDSEVIEGRRIRQVVDCLGLAARMSVGVRKW